MIDPLPGDHRRGIAQLEADLALAREHGAKATRAMWLAVVRDLRAERRSLREARTRAARLKRERDTARAEVRDLRRCLEDAERRLADLGDQRSDGLLGRAGSVVRRGRRRS